MDLETLNEMYRERAKLVEAQFAACETADAAAACASGFLGAIREAYVAGCEDVGLRRRAVDLLTACQSAAGLIAGLTLAEVSLLLPKPSPALPRAHRALGGLRPVRARGAFARRSPFTYCFEMKSPPRSWPPSPRSRASSCPSSKCPPRSCRRPRAVPRPRPERDGPADRAAAPGRGRAP